MCFLNSQCYVKRHNIFSLTKYQLSSPHSLPLIYWRWGLRSSEKLWILTVLKIRWGGLFLLCGLVVLQILIKTYKNTPNLKSKSE